MTRTVKTRPKFQLLWPNENTNLKENFEKGLIILQHPPRNIITLPRLPES